MYRIAVLASGRGSNLQAIIDAIAAGTLPARLVGVFSDKADAPALARAQAAGIPSLALAPAGFPAAAGGSGVDRRAFDQALFEAIGRTAPDLVVCAGYLRLIDAGVVEARHGHLVNIHPSLLPLFKGLGTHRQALVAGVAEHGASVHFVTAELDGGPVIAQARVPVLPGDDTATLAARVLAREHPLLVECLRGLAAGRIRLRGNHVLVDGSRLTTPLQLGANNTFA